MPRRMRRGRLGNARPPHGLLHRAVKGLLVRMMPPHHARTRIDRARARGKDVRPCLLPWSGWVLPRKRVGEIDPSRSGFRYALAHPSIPPVGRGRSIGCPMTYSPSRREGARGWAIQFRPSLCSSTDILYPMGIDLAVPGCRIRLVELLDPGEADTRFATARWVRNASTSAAPMSRGCRLF